jgi:F420-non-reducing hydrogenase small subunit
MSEKAGAFYWCASCGGCEEAVVDLHEKILDVVQAVEIVLWPVALDFKRKDIEAIPDGGIVATSSTARQSTEQEMAHLLRRKSGGSRWVRPVGRHPGTREPVGSADSRAVYKSRRAR